MATVVCQHWYESERGWGQRPDGVSLQLSEKDRVAYCEKYWEEEKKRNTSGKVPDKYSIPDEYSKENGSPVLIDLDKRSKLYKDLVKSKYGIRVYGASVVNWFTRVE